MNRGAERLAAKIKTRGDQARLVEELGVDQGYLSRIVTGERVPGLEVRKRIKEKLRIPLDAWDQEPKKRDSERAREAS